ncbi:MAG: antitoxin [Treponema sp.]|nr:antitoxin [Treponema sp.]
MGGRGDFLFGLDSLKQITIWLDDQVIDYFKSMAEETGMPYQNIINYYLLDCVKEKRRLELVFGK